MHQRLKFALATTFTALIVLSFAGVHGNAQQAAAAKVARLLNESTFTVTKIDSDLWTIPFAGKSMKEITVMVTVSEDLFLAYAPIPESKNVKFTPQVLLKLLKFNEQYDRVKVGIDKEGVVFVRVDMTARTLDKEDLTFGTEQVAAVVDEVHSEIRAHLPKTK